MAEIGGLLIAALAWLLTLDLFNRLRRHASGTLSDQVKARLAEAGGRTGDVGISAARLLRSIAGSMWTWVFLGAFLLLAARGAPVRYMLFLALAIGVVEGFENYRWTMRSTDFRMALAAVDRPRPSPYVPIYVALFVGNRVATLIGICLFADLVVQGTQL